MFGKNFLGVAAAAVMLGASHAMPSFGQRYTPTFRTAAAYNGDGRKVKAKTHPMHGSSRRTKSWQDYADKVRATQSWDAFGNRQDDPRDPKYLHSHARSMRGLKAALSARAA